MTEQKFTVAQMQAAHMAGQIEAGDENPVRIAAQAYVEEVTELNVEQVYRNDNIYGRPHDSFLGTNPHPLTPQEAGKEPMQHLIDGLTLITSPPPVTSKRGYTDGSCSNGIGQT